MDTDSNIPIIEIPLQWTPVLVKEKPFPWHRQIPGARDTDNIAGPRVYRWLFLERSAELSSAYIGQTERFEDRLCDYRLGNRSGDDAEVLAAMRQCEQDGGSIELHFLDLSSGRFRINGKLITHAALRDHDVRLMLENIAIVTARFQGMRLRNHLRDDAAFTSLMRIVKQYPEVFGPVTDQKKALLAREIVKLLP